MNSPAHSKHQASLAATKSELEELAIHSPEFRIPTPQSVTSGIHTIRQLIDTIKADAFSGLADYCVIPEAYKSCSLAFDFKPLPDEVSPESASSLSQGSKEVINPHPVHLDTIALFRKCLQGDPLFTRDRDPLKPNFGAYLYGPPGSGKTHLMAAFAGELRASLDKRLDGAFKGVDSLVLQYYREYSAAVAKGGPMESGARMRWVIPDNPGSSEQELGPSNPADQFAIKCNQLRERMRQFPIQPTDILYISFDSICKLYQESSVRMKSISILENAPIVFVDDLFIPKDQEGHLEIAKALIENRLANGRIATFITSNVSPEQLIDSGSVLNQRLISRCKELYIPLDFSGVPDWRETVRARKNRHLLSLIRTETDQQVIGLSAKAIEAGLGESWGKRSPD